MEATKVIGKKSKQLGKTKLKQTIKNVLCRPDHYFWPALSEGQSEVLANIISKHKVEIPENNRPPWSVLKSIPKNERPKVKRVRNIPGFIFGLAQCARLIKSGDCKGVIIDGNINPRILVAHIIEGASENKTPVVCMADLKKITSCNFGFPSCCVALTKTAACEDIKDKVTEYWNMFTPQDANTKVKTPCELEVTQQNNTKEKIPREMEVTQDNTIEKIPCEMELTQQDNTKEKKLCYQMEVEKTPTNDIDKKEDTFKYLIRTSKNYRVFVPPSSDKRGGDWKELSAENYIKLSEYSKDTKEPRYKGMILKRVTSNPKRKTNKT